ncbi:E3 ubiquitin-protein ligase LRSAM1-like isoform X2 [Bacillus rossius redtenbacheri]|uniref:E3 ubiquitin-protein ligase LRSAM1-like isoform X2 n=1 Tax=Bacillus rossius redtenbacheri TaxID=93214 RepID=UPI002FDD8582
MLPALFSKKKKEIDYKAKLEHKLYLAREDPEPVFDLSDCALRHVPAGVYSLCRVFRKEMLYLQENQLTSLKGGGSLQDLSLLCVLDIHLNQFTHLPEDIHLLSNLKVLNASCNRLKALPEGVGRLAGLERLDVSSNELRGLPGSLGALGRLHTLDLRGNPGLSALPPALGRIPALRQLLLDPGLARAELGVQHMLQETCSSMSASDNTVPEQDTHLEAKLQLLEREKEQRQKERLLVEQQLEELRRKEVEFQNTMKLNKDKLLECLATQQSQLERELQRLQLDREASRAQLVEQLQQEERSTDRVISQLLSLSGSSRSSAQLCHLLEQELKEEERLLNAAQDQYRTLRRREILDAMESLFEEECCREAKLREYEQGRVETSRTLLSLEVEADRRLAGLLRSQTHSQGELVSQLQRDEQLQRAAVAALLERGDARSCALVHQVAVVQRQLAALTAMEVKRRKLHVAQQLEELSQKRVSLSEVLVDLLSQQAKRRKQLLDILQRMEQQRLLLHQNDGGEGRGEEDFWLRQYQLLVDCRPCSLVELERSLDPALAHCLVLSGAVHCLPFLSGWLQSPERLQLLTEDDLQQDRAAVLEAVHTYLDNVKAASGRPSAPCLSYLDDEVAATECAICMDSLCEVIFVPCGHMCCCTKCSEVLQQCPLCRTSIDQKVRVIRS